MDLRQLECFLEVKEQMHFGRAAQRLYLAQPTVSETIKRLERELGGQLFDRSTRRVTLTPLGEAFAVEAQAAYDAVRAAYATGQAVARQQANQFVVGHTGDYAPLVDTAVEFQRSHLGVLVRLRLQTTPRLMDALRDRRVHAAIVWDDADEVDFESIVLDTARLAAVAPADHPLAALGSTTLAQLASELLIAWPRVINPATYDRFAAAMDATGAPWALVGAATGIENVTARVLSGFGIGIVYDTFARSMPAGVVTVPVTDEAARLTRRMAWRRGEKHAALEPFIELVARQARQTREPGADE